MFAVRPVGRHKPNTQPTETQERRLLASGGPDLSLRNQMMAYFSKRIWFFMLFCGNGLCRAMWRGWGGVSAPGFCGWNLSSHATLQTHGLSIGSSVQALGWKPSVSPSFHHHSCHGLVTPHMSLLRTLKKRTAQKFAQSCTADEEGLEG